MGHVLHRPISAKSVGAHPTEKGNENNPVFNFYHAFPGGLTEELCNDSIG